MDDSYYSLFHSCEFAYSLKCICNPQINGTLAVVHGSMQGGKKFDWPNCTRPQPRSNKATLPFGFCSHTVYRYPFCGLFSATLFAFLWAFLLLVAILLF